MRKLRLRKFTNILKKSNLETRLEVSNQMAFMELISILGYRKSKSWTPEENAIFDKLMQYSKTHTEHQLQLIKKWVKDGSPTT